MLPALVGRKTTKVHPVPALQVPEGDIFYVPKIKTEPEARGLQRRSPNVSEQDIIKHLQKKVKEQQNQILEQAQLIEKLTDTIADLNCMVASKPVFLPGCIETDYEVETEDEVECLPVQTTPIKALQNNDRIAWACK